MSDVCGGSTIQHVFSPIFSLVKRKLYVSSINQFRCDDQVTAGILESSIPACSIKLENKIKVET
jgi:hypothetical protein